MSSPSFRIFVVCVIDCRFLINRLDRHGDRWREAPMGVLEENSVFQVTPKSEKGGRGTSHNAKEEKPRKGTKRKGAKADPNAPKRPANPFFQFCQEQRPRVMERLAGEPEPSKQELTRQLATTWKSLSSEDKKVNILTLNIFSAIVDLDMLFTCHVPCTRVHWIYCIVSGILRYVWEIQREICRRDANI